MRRYAALAFGLALSACTADPAQTTEIEQGATQCTIRRIPGGTPTIPTSRIMDRPPSGRSKGRSGQGEVGPVAAGRRGRGAPVDRRSRHHVPRATAPARTVAPSARVRLPFWTVYTGSAGLSRTRTR